MICPLVLYRGNMFEISTDVAVVVIVCTAMSNAVTTIDVFTIGSMTKKKKKMQSSDDLEALITLLNSCQCDRMQPE
eukprot:m.152869 g.152869  ORF g.152869 m.152869 type:complete len:76 (-) comp30817_c2_seq2:23-250(-)